MLHASLSWEQGLTDPPKFHTVALTWGPCGTHGLEVGLKRFSVFSPLNMDIDQTGYFLI